MTFTSLKNRLTLNSSRKLATLTLLAIVSFALAGQAALAQTFYGSVVGTATDSTGAIVGGATVTLTNLATAQVRKATTDTAGDYQFPNLLPAQYKVEITFTGFKKFLVTPVTVEVESTVRINAVMEVGVTTETVEVSASALPLLNTESGSLGDTVNGKIVAETALNGRNPLNLLELVPSVVPQGNTNGSAAMNQAGNGTSSAAWGNYQIGGGLPLQSSMYIDGAPIQIMNKNFTALVPTQDSIQEFRVETSGASAEFGRFGGGIINMTTKTGGNQIHGSLYEYIRNRDFDANFFFSKRSGLGRPQNTQNQFGVAASGPIWREKAFFFVNWEGFHVRKGLPVLTNVPTQALLDGVYTAKIADPNGVCNIQPYTGQTVNGHTYASGGYYIANLYQAGLKAGTTCGDPTSRIFSSFYPLPNATGSSNYAITQSEGDDSHQWTLRGDYNVNSKNRMFARITFWPLTDIAPTILPVVSKFNTTGSQNHNHTNQFAVGDTITLTPTTLIDVRADFLRQYGDAVPPVLGASATGGPGGVDESQFGPAYGALSPYMTFHDLPAFSFATGTQLHSLFTFGYAKLLAAYYNNYHLSGTLTKIIGKHTIKAGAEGRLINREDYGSSSAPSGLFTFSSDLGVGDEFANFQMGYFDSGTLTTNKRVTTFNWYNAYFATDTWQVNPKLTANLGIRWERPGTFSEANDNLAVLLPNTTDPYTGITGTVGLVNSSLYAPRGDLNTHNDLFGPRVGLAYRLTNSTAIRAGYSLSYLPPDGQVYAYANNSLLNAATTTNKNTSTAITYTVANPFPAGVIAAPGRSNPQFMKNFIGQTVVAPNPIEPFPHEQEMNVSVGHQFSHEMLIDVGLAHTLGTHLPRNVANFIGLDQLPDQYDAMGPALAAKPATPLVYGGVTLPTALQTVGQSLRPYPAYNNYSNGADFGGNTSYNALETKFQKRFGTSGQIGVSYTWMKIIGDADTILPALETSSGGSGWNGQGVFQDFTNLKAERSIYSYDVPNRFVLNYVLNLPFGHGHRFLPGVTGLADHLVSGWALNGITSLQSGFPIFLDTSGNQLSKFYGAGTIRPNYTPGCNKSINDSSYDRTLAGHTWYNVTCFTTPTSAGTAGAILSGANAYAFGNEPRADAAIRSSGVANSDISLVKSTTLRDALSLQFRAEFYNVLNRVQFAPPVTQIDNAQAGQILGQANEPRRIQFAVRLNF